MSLHPGMKAPASIKAKNLTQQYGGVNSYSALWYPQTKEDSWLITLKSNVMELLATFVFVFLTVYAVVTSVLGTGDSMIRSLVVAIVSGGSYFMVTGWLRKPDEELPRHASWTVTLGKAAVMRFGFLQALFYWISQFIGTLLAACLLYVLGFQTGNPVVGVLEAYVPQTEVYLTDSAGRHWFAEIIASFAIVFSMLYNHMAGVERENEIEHVRGGEIMASLARTAFTLLFFRVGHWTFDPIVYLGGLLTTCFHGTCLSGTAGTLATGIQYPAIFFLLVPFIGMIVAILFYLLGVLLSGGVGMRKSNGGGTATAGRQIHTQYVKLAE